MSSLDELTARPDWHEHAACRGCTSLFYPTRGENATQAKAVCARCPVRQQCLDAALRRPERFGVWGGLSEDERQQERRNRQQLRAVPDMPIRQPKPINHDTDTGYQAHRDRGEKPCDACTAAHHKANLAYQQRKVNQCAS